MRGRRADGQRVKPAHETRPTFRARPVHVTMRMRRDVQTSLRNGKMHRRVRDVLAAARSKLDCRIVQYAVLRNHLHLLIEAQDQRALARAMKGFTVRLARRVNSTLDRNGAVFPQRYHAHVLETPREMRNALVYILNNAKKHGREHGLAWASDRTWVDACSSAAYFDGWAAGCGPRGAPMPCRARRVGFLRDFLAGLALRSERTTRTMKTAHLALVVALWSAAGCVVSSRLLGRSGSNDGSPSSPRSSASSNDRNQAAATAPGDAAAPPAEAPPELGAEPLDPAYRPYQPENAKRLLAELEAVHADPGKRARPDDEILIELYVYANALYVHGDAEQKPWAVQMWTRGKQLAKTPANVGSRDEVESKSLRWAAIAVADLRSFARGNLVGAYDPNKSLAELDEHVGAHEKEFLAGKQSARARALLAAGKQIAADHRKEFAAQGAKATQQRGYDEDPEVKKLESDWHDLNVEAGSLAERLGEDAPSNWANSTHPALKPYQKKLTAYQAKLRRLRKKHGLPE